MNWEAVTAFGTVFTGLVILATAVVGVNQLRQFRAQRQDAAAVELVRSIQDDTLLRSYLRVFASLTEPDGREPHMLGDRLEEAAVVVGFRLEMLGVLVYHGAVPFELAEELVGGLVVGAWRRLRKTTLETRQTLAWPTYLEWFQWLAEQFEKRGRLDQTPAFTRFADWQR